MTELGVDALLLSLGASASRAADAGASAARDDTILKTVYHVDFAETGGLALPITGSL